MLAEMYRDEAEPHPETHCKKGCASCCYLDVDAYRIEAQYALEGHPDPDTVFERARRHRGRLSFSPCPFLDVRTRTCEVYDRRPTTCRQYASFSKLACRQQLESKGAKPKRGILTDMHLRTHWFEVRRSNRDILTGEVKTLPIWLIELQEERDACPVGPEL